MLFCSRNTSGFLEKSTLFISIFHVPSKTLCAAAGIGIDRAANTKSKNSLFIESLHEFELRPRTISELALTIGNLYGRGTSFETSGESPLPERRYESPVPQGREGYTDSPPPFKFAQTTSLRRRA